MAKRINYKSMFTLRPDGRYQGYWHELDANGEPKGKRHTICDKDPEKLYFRIQEKESQQAEIPTFREVAETWDANHVSSLERSTQKTYKAPLEYLISELGNKAITEIRAADVNRLLLREKAQGYSFKHAASIKSILKQILDSAVVTGYIDHNPTAAVNVPRGMKKSHIEAPEDNQLEIIKANLDKPFGDFVAMLLYTGMRTEEAAALTWEDIGPEEITVRNAVDLHGTPKLKSVKTDAGERKIPILRMHRPYLRKPSGARATDFVFNINGKLLTRGQITSRWLNWCKAAGLAEQKTYDNRHRGEKECTRTEWRPLVSPHQLRHNYATVLYEQDVDELTAKDVMGHKDISTTRKIYTSLRQKHRGEEVKKIEDGF